MNSREDLSTGRKPMTGRELKRLRLKRSAIVSRQRRQEETFRPDVSEAALNEDPRNSYDILVQAIYEDINKEKDSESSSTEECASTAATSNSGSAGQEQELTVTAVPTSPLRLHTQYENMDNHDDHKAEIGMRRLRKGAILQKNDTLAKIESVDEYKSPASPSKYNYFGVDLSLTRPTTQIQPVNDSEVKSNRSTDNDFSKPPRSLEDRRETRLREKQKFDNFLRGEVSSRSEVRGHQQILEHNHDSLQTADSSADANDITSVNSSSSYDTYGFDTFGFSSPNQRSEIQSAIDDAVSISAASALSDTFEFILEHRSSPEVEEIQKNNPNRSGLTFVANHFKFAMRKYARRKTRPFDDDEKSTTSMKKTASAEARRLRSLRLRVTTIGRNIEPLGSLDEKNEDKEQFQEEGERKQQAQEQEEEKQEPQQQNQQNEQVQEQQQEEDEEELVLQEQLVEEKASSGALQYEGDSHQVEQGNDDEDKYIMPKSLSRLSIVSELTFVSEKLLSKVDELSFLCGNQTSMTCQSETEYCRRMDCEELDPPSDTEDPSVYFDASMKTPPRYLLNPTLKDDFLDKRENGISGSPGASNRLKPGENRVEHVLPDRPIQEDAIGKETKKKELHGIFGRMICLFDDMEESDDKSQGSTSFSRIWREETPNVEEKYENAAPAGLSVSTVSIEEEDYASYYIENEEEYIKDLENYGKDARQIYSC